MFKLDPNPTFSAPVEIHVPGQGKGQFVAVFRFLDQAAREAYVSGLAEKNNLEALSEIMVGWQEMDASFNRENLARLLNNYPKSANALFDVFFKELSGAAVKN